MVARRRALLWMAAAAAVAFLLWPPLRYGWTHADTDFPNYYTAAVMAKKHLPLRDLYDWVSFQRQMNYAGWGLQLGGYIPHTPLTMLPIFPLAGLPPMTAKRVWLAANLVFLAAAIWLLAKLTRLPAAGLLLLLLLGRNALGGNFELGQYYVFLVLLLALGLWLLFGGRPFLAGLVLGVVLVLKLYGGPFLVYFAWKRRWRALAGMLAATLALGAVSIAWFGWKDQVDYVTHVLPRPVAGEHIDPYAAGMPTLLNMLRHPFEKEAELNPHPLADAPALVFFLQPLVTLSVLVFCVIALPRGGNEDAMRGELAWFLVALVLMSPSRAFYAGILLIVPAALLLEKARARRAIWVIAAYLLVTIALPDSWDPYFPTVWILIAAYVALGIPYWRNLRPAMAALAAAAILCVAGVSAYRRMASYYREPPRKFERVALEPDAIYSSSPAVSAAGIVFESIDDGRYLLKRWNPGGLEKFSFDGLAFHPAAAPAGGEIFFELVAGGHSRIMGYDPRTKALRQVVASGLDPREPSVSPEDGGLAFLAGDRIVISSGGSLKTIDGPAPVHSVSWFPDGGDLVYSAGPSGSAQIFATTASGASEQLTRDSGDHLEPAVSPDGSRLAYTVARGGARQVWIQNLGNGDRRQLTEGSCNSYAPAWDLDGRSLVFACDCQRGVGLPALFRARLN